MKNPEYHLYIDFWSKDDMGEHTLLIVERDFKDFAGLIFTKEKMETAIGGKKF